MKTYGDLLNNLIAHYEWCVSNLPKDDDRRLAFLIEHHVHAGICYCSIDKFKTDIYYTPLVKDFIGDDDKHYLCDKPAGYSFYISKDLLQTRINRMKEILPEWKDVITE